MPLDKVRGRGDIFYADSSPEIVIVNKLVNHGHNGIFVSTTNTVEAAEGSLGNGVYEVDNRAAPKEGLARFVDPSSAG